MLAAERAITRPGMVAGGVFGQLQVQQDIAAVACSSDAVLVLAPCSAKIGSMNSPIKDVSDTAFWIAHHRRLETERSDALFQDPFAAKLAGERGRRISEAMPTSRVVAWTVALRTRIIDEYLQFAINSGVDTVLSLGAGLDARPYRMNLPASLHWVEADYPQILDYKAGQLQADEPRCQLERVQIESDRGVSDVVVVDRGHGGQIGQRRGPYRCWHQ